MRNELNKYDKQRHQGDSSQQVGISKPPQTSYLQLSSSSSQSAAIDPHNLGPGYGMCSGTQQRSRRKKTQPYRSPMSVQQTGRASRY